MNTILNIVYGLIASGLLLIVGLRLLSLYDYIYVRLIFLRHLPIYKDGATVKFNGGESVQVIGTIRYVVYDILLREYRYVIIGENDKTYVVREVMVINNIYEGDM